MATITIPREFVDRIPAARNFIENVAKHDPNWNGATFEINEGDCYTIDCDDELAGASLFQELGHSIGIFG